MSRFSMQNGFLFSSLYPEGTNANHIPEKAIVISYANETDYRIQIVLEFLYFRSYEGVKNGKSMITCRPNRGAVLPPY